MEESYQHYLDAVEEYNNPVETENCPDCGEILEVSVENDDIKGMIEVVVCSSCGYTETQL